MEIERGAVGAYAYAAVGAGDPVAAFPGLSPVTGVESDRMVEMTIGPLSVLAPRHRLVVLNRRPALPRGMTMAALAAEHARAIATGLDGPVDVVGTSTGGSIAQQLAAEHPEVVRRLVLVSAACRLGPEARVLQRRVAARLRAGAERQALAVLAAGLVPPRRGRTAAAALAWLAGPRVLADSQGLADMATTIEAEDEFDLARCAGTIRAPTLILVGSEDRFYGRELFEETARLIPGARLHVFEGRGHITVMRDPRFAAALTEFLADPSGDAAA